MILKCFIYLNRNTKNTNYNFIISLNIVFNKFNDTVPTCHRIHNKCYRQRSGRILIQ